MNYVCTAAILMIFSGIFCIVMSSIITEDNIKIGNGIGIMRGNVSDYRRVEVPYTLEFDDFDCIFTATNGYIIVKYRAKEGGHAKK